MNRKVISHSRYSSGRWWMVNSVIIYQYRKIFLNLCIYWFIFDRIIRFTIYELLHTIDNWWDALIPQFGSENTIQLSSDALWFLRNFTCEIRFFSSSSSFKPKNQTEIERNKYEKKKKTLKKTTNSFQPVAMRR